MPKWHVVGDSIHEMVVVGKDHLRKRQRLREASSYFQWLICKRRMSVYCCFCCKRKGSLNESVYERASNMVLKEFDLVRMIKRLRQAESLMYAMTTKGQRKLARWQCKHVVKLYSSSDESPNGHEAAVENKDGPLIDDGQTTGSELDFDEKFSAKLVNMVERDYTTMNLHLLKGVLKPPNSRYAKGSNWDEDQEIPMSLDEVMRRQRIRLEDEIAEKQKIIEKE